ncbi:MAG: SpoIID/LytB domain-containing protein [Candidatus Hydrogenedentes bacterium]|jgi:stage II sporulation protein D|nr:SpoIID/LytB domain-containing protein [Candidatus Hydrogenedentota bacterium]
MFFKNNRSQLQKQYASALMLMLGLSMAAAAAMAQSEETVSSAHAQVRMRYAVLPDAVTFKTTAAGSLEAGASHYPLEAGTWTLRAENLQPARQHFYVFKKSFQPGDEVQRDAFIALWRQRGYTPQIKTLGKRFRTGTGRIIDNRVYWIAIARFDKEADATALAQSMQDDPIRPWIRSERVLPGSCTFTLQGTNTSKPLTLTAPLKIHCTAPIEIMNLSDAYWKSNQRNRLFHGPLEITVGYGRDLEVYGTLAVEEYLRGVVPAEMPASWPLEALKAQAIVARSEIYASMAGKYELEGFDFTIFESCRAYNGVSGHAVQSDAAVAQTKGMALVAQNKYISAVFSSCCGGWTENNDNVWSGPPDPVLRGKSDLRTNSPSISPAQNLRTWLTTAPDAWCAGDSAGYRWQKSYSRSELTEIVNQRHNLGTVLRIEEGARGVSGRLKTLTIVGEKDSITLTGELNIRQAFGGLPSAMVIIETVMNGTSPAVYTFTGGGRGHGVGMCQYGARGMASAGKDFAAIAAHYFPHADLERTME